MRVNELLESDTAGNVSPQLMKYISTLAQNGDRIIADGKTIWAGLGNRAGLHSYQYEVLKDKWKKSGTNFMKKLSKLNAQKIEVQRFRNRTRDLGNWQTIHAIDVKAEKSIDYDH